MTVQRAYQVPIREDLRVAILFLSLWGVAAITIGLASITNAKGFNERSARVAVRVPMLLFRPLRNVPPWKSEFAKPSEEQVAKQLRLVRIMGPILLVAGVLSLAMATAAGLS